MKRNQWLMEEYKKRFSYTCMNPECKSGFDIETHHIIPIYSGGIDDELNYISLCLVCHSKVKFYKKAEEQEITLATWKYYYESLFEAAEQGNELAIAKIKIIKSIKEERLEDTL